MIATLRRWMMTCLAAILAAGCSQTESDWSAKSPAPRNADATPVIARSVLFGNPDKTSPRISPDGTKLAFLAPDQGVMNVWVGPADDPAAARVVTSDRTRGIRMYRWAHDNDHVIYMQDTGGDENWHIYATNLTTHATKDLTPFDAVQARIQQTSRKHPKEVLLALNNRNPALHDIHRVNIETAEATLVEQNTGYAGYITDDDFNIRLAMKYSPTGGSEIYKRADGAWTLFTSIPQADSLSTSPVALDKSGKTLYMIDSRDGNTAGFVGIDIESGRKTMLATNDRCDVGGIMMHPTEKTPEAVAFTYTRREWQILDKSVEDDFKFLKTVADGDFGISSRSVDDKNWIVSYTTDNGPRRYYRYDRAAGKAHFLFTDRSKLEGLPLAKMHPQVIESRDNHKLVSYFTLPVWTDPDNNARPDKPLPTVLMVHGGPWGRDMWGMNTRHQWLANRGYAVLSVNFRGSTGFGKRFINAGDGEWAGKMHDDLIDAVNWAVDQKIADPKRVAIMGGSYGGYAALVGLTFTPEVFACGVDIVGPSNLITLMNNIPAYWRPILPVLTSRVGDHKTEAGRAFLAERSPLTHAGRIVRPLLIGQGANDPRVNQVESDQIVNAMKERDIPVTYVLFPDEGHGFARPQNRTAFNAVAEAFLAQHLGGRFEPIGDDFTDSSITVPNGIAGVPGLAEVMKTR